MTRVLLLGSGSRGILRFCENLSEGMQVSHPDVEIDYLNFNSIRRPAPWRSGPPPPPPPSPHHPHQRQGDTEAMFPGVVPAHALVALREVGPGRHHDIIHVNYALSSYLAPVVRRTASLVYTLHGFPRPVLERGLVSKLLYGAEAVMLSDQPPGIDYVSISSFVQKIIRQTYGLGSTMIHHGLDEAVFRPASGAAKVTIRRRLGIDEGSVVVIWVGRFVPMKDPMTFIRALVSLKRTRVRGLTAVMIGDGPLGDNVRRTVRDESLAVRLLSDLPFSELVDYYRASDIHVASSIGEPFGYTLLEAMASGSVPLVTTSGAHTEIVPPDFDTFYGVGDHGKLADLIMRVAEDKPLIERLSENSRERVLASFTLKRMADSYRDLYDRVR